MAKAKVKLKAAKVAICREVSLPEDLRVTAALEAIRAFPANAPVGVYEPARLALLTSKWWGKDGADLTVGFMERPSQAVIDKVLGHANSWDAVAGANVRFRWTQTSPQIRVSFGRGGYYSYLGRDCLQIPASQHTMNLEGFGLRTPESEWVRVVRHEFGHALGCPHEQQRKAILELLDERKTIAYFMRTQGWSAEEVRQQILVPLEERSILGSELTDQVSIMCYAFPAAITTTGRPILGGADFSPTDRAFIAKAYPKPEPPPPPPPPPSDGQPYRIRIEDRLLIVEDSAGKVTGKFVLTPEKVSAAWKLTREA